MVVLPALPYPHDALAPFREHATALWALGKLAIHRTH